MVPRLVKLFDFPGRGAAQIYAGYTCSFAVSETGTLGLGIGQRRNAFEYFFLKNTLFLQATAFSLYHKEAYACSLVKRFLVNAVPFPPPAKRENRNVDTSSDLPNACLLRERVSL